ncbi:MAG: hypothetical protein AAB073_01440, partial [Pseudomonadota bacterium]
MEQTLARGVRLYFESRPSPPHPPRSGFVQQHCRAGRGQERRAALTVKVSRTRYASADRHPWLG